MKQEVRSKERTKFDEADKDEKQSEETRSLLHGNRRHLIDAWVNW
jgi:hypothetical protein